MRSTFRIFSLAFAAMAMLTPAASQAGLFSDDPPAEITKVKYSHIQLDKSMDTSDKMIQFERRYLLYGAVTSEEYKEREGKYYTIFWKSKDRSPGMVIRFEYLQANTGDTIKVKEIAVDDIRRGNTTNIQVTGDEYRGDGNVLAWRVSLVRDEQVLDTVESFLWK